jgi:hypothetical protein
MNKRLLLSLTSFCILLLAACIKDVGKPVQTATTPPPVGFCDTIKYNKHIKPIIMSNCSTTGCHVSGGTGPGDFTIFTELKDKVTNGKFKARVIDADPSPMPAAGQLPAAQLNIIKCWLEKGANND